MICKLIGGKNCLLGSTKFSIFFINVFLFFLMSFSLLNQTDILSLGIPPPNGQVQYRHQGNSTGCVPGSTVARRWRWALKGSVAHTQQQRGLEETPCKWPLRRIGVTWRFKCPTTSVCLCDKFIERTNGLKISP